MNKHAELMRIASQIINVASPADFEYTKKLIEAAEEIERQEPVAYAVFAENGNIRIWCADPVQVETLRQQYGEELQPLYTTPQTTEQRCEYCDGTGDVHSIDGEWRGTCDCQKTEPDVAGLVEALEEIAQSRDSGRHDGLPEDGPALSDVEAWLVANDALAAYRSRGEV